MKKLIAISVVMLLFAFPAFGSINWIGGVQTCQITVSLTIPPTAKLLCQDNSIIFSNNNVSGYTPGTDGDWFGTTWDGWYSAITSGNAPGGCDSKASTDAYAGAGYITGDPWNQWPPTGIYYEATDYANHWIETNAAITGNYTTTDLTNPSSPNTIPHRFTCAFGWFWTQAGVLDATGGSGIPPGSGVLGAFVNTGNTLDSPSPMAHSGATVSISAGSQGTVTFHSRILRRGMYDVSGNWTANINVSYN